jgi:hypothetical protein
MAGILNGIDALVDSELGLPKVGKAPHYHHRQSWEDLVRRQGAPDKWPTLISKMAALVETNWDGRRSRGVQNWRHTREGDIATRNSSLEKLIEKGIAKLGDDAWANQVPICSGVNDAHDGKRSVDLAYLNGEDLELIELKVDSNTPLFAAVEVLVYGLVYRLSRRHREALGYTLEKNPLVFNVRTVALKVLAPAGYYGAADAALRGIEDGVATGLGALPQDEYRMMFRFEHFGLSPERPEIITPEYCRGILGARAPMVER